MKLNMTSNHFNDNSAINGGGVYIDREQDDTDDEISIIANDNIFFNNTAEQIGGAIYVGLERLSLEATQDNIIKYCKAGNLGGGMYIAKFYNENVFSKFVFINNTANSIQNDYTSKPSYILLKSNYTKNEIITSGKYFPLKFELYDAFNNIIFDISKFYYLMTLNVSLEKIDDLNNINDNNYNSDENSNYYLEGNTGTFIYGKYLFYN